VVRAYHLLPRDLPECDRIPLLDEPVLLALHPDEAATRGLAPGAEVGLTDVADLRWLVPGPETSCPEMIRRACGAAGFVMTATAHATDFAVLAAMVEAGAGAALMPRMTLPARLPASLSLHPLRPPLSRSISVLTRTGESGHPGLARVRDGLLRASAHHTRALAQVA
jgi:DNA-binding transcriptional LysR family regulator